MKFVSVDQRGDQWRLWCTSNIRSWPERYRRSQYTPRSSWRQRTYSSWYLQTTRRRMRLKDLHLVSSTVTTNFEASVRATMESTHDHAMRLQASQQVAPPGIPPPPCRAQSDLDEMSHHDLTYLFFSFDGDVRHDYYLIGDVMLIWSFMVLWCVSIFYILLLHNKMYVSYSQWGTHKKFSENTQMLNSNLKKILREKNKKKQMFSQHSEVRQNFRFMDSHVK